MRRLLRLVAAAAAAAAVAAACGGDAPSEGLVASSLRQVPASLVDGTVLLTIGDADAATRLAGVKRPDPGDDGDYTDWLIELDGSTRGGEVNLLWPQNINQAPASELADEIGFTLSDVRNFVEVGQPPNSFVVFDGVGADRIEDALGERDDGLWMIGKSEDFDPDDVTRLRPIGAALFMGERSGRVAYGQRRETMSQWLEGGESLLDDPALASVARHLDAAKVYSAIVFSPENPVALPGADDPGYALWSIVAVGLLPEDEPVGVIVYHHDNDDDAVANARIIEDQFRNGQAARGNASWSDFVTVRSVQVDGADVVVTLELDRASRLSQALMIGEPLLTAGLG